MEISFLKFDLEIAEKVDSIFKKYGIKFKYTNFIKKLQKKYSNRMRAFVSDYCEDEFITIKNTDWIKRFKNLPLCEDQSVFTINDGFLYEIDIPCIADDQYNFSYLQYETEDINVFDDIEKYLKLTFERYEKMNKLFNDETFIELKEEFNKLDKLEEEQEQKNKEHRTKLENRMKKLMKVKKDFE